MTRVGHWPLSEDSDGTAYDYSGGENHGTANGAGPSGTGTVDGPLGSSAYDFDGSDDDVSLGGLDFDNADPITLACWVNRDSGTGSIFLDDGKAELNYEIRGADGYEWRTSDGSGNSTNVTSGDTRSGEWIHLCGTFEGGDMALYIDGVEVGSATSADWHPNNAFYAGSNATGGYFDGKIAQCRVYERALSPVEVAYLYEASRAGRLVTEVKRS